MKVLFLTFQLQLEIAIVGKELSHINLPSVAALVISVCETLMRKPTSSQRLTCLELSRNFRTNKGSPKVSLLIPSGSQASLLAT